MGELNQKLERWYYLGMKKGRQEIRDKDFEKFIKKKDIYYKVIEPFYRYNSERILEDIYHKNGYYFGKRTIKAINKKFNQYKVRTGVPVILYEPKDNENENDRYTERKPDCWVKKLACDDSFCINSSLIPSLASQYGMIENEFIKLLKDFKFEHYENGKHIYIEPRLHLFDSVTSASAFIYKSIYGKDINRIYNYDKRKEANEYVKNCIAPSIRKAIKKDGLVHNAYGFLVVKVDDIA